MQGQMRWVIAAVAAIVVVALVAAVFLAVRITGASSPVTSAGRGKPLDVTTWAHQMCQSEANYAEALTKSADNVDVRTLALDARKQRANKVGQIEIDASNQVAKDLRAMTPPDAATVYHNALIRDAEEEAAATKEQLEAIAKATTEQQFVLANAQYRFRQDASGQNLNAALQGLAPDVQTALSSEPLCTGAPVPVAPSGPGGAPTTPGQRPGNRPPPPGRGPA